MRKPKPISVKVGGKTFTLQFRHTTVCEISAEEPSRVVLTGQTNCSRSDHFNKETGNKLALTRAIADLPRATRKEIWDTYLIEAGLCWPAQIKANTIKQTKGATNHGR